MASLIQPTQIKCCSTPDWQPRAYACSCCGARVEAEFAPQEFSNLSPDELHFLRIFVWAEGRVKEMEGPLGMSYPTIRNRLSLLRDKIFGGHAPALAAESSEHEPLAETPKPKNATSHELILEALARKEITFEEAMKKLKD